MRSSLLLALLALLLACAAAAPAKESLPQLIPDLHKAILSQRIQLISLLAPNCSRFPNITEERPSVLPFFAIIPASPAHTATPRKAGEPLFTLGKDAASSKFAAYLPLMNRVNTVFEQSFGQSISTSFKITLAKRTRFEDAGFGTFDFQSGVFAINEDILRYLPDAPSAQVVDFYAILEEDLAKESAEGELTLERLARLLVKTATRLVGAMKQDPAACFFCVIVGGTLIALAANILAYLYSLRVCEYCGLSSDACFYVSLYYLFLVYQNLPLLAAILFRLCSDVCVYAFSSL